MRFWTIQPAVVWERMERGEAVRVDPGHPKYGGKRPWQYDWLAAGLRRNRPGFDGGWPWWLSCEAPDLERCRASKHPGGRAQSVIELELPEERSARLPLWMWETIHLGKYLALSRAALDDWYRALRRAVPVHAGVRPLPEPWQGLLEASWERIFDRDVEPGCWYRHEARDVRARMGAVTDELVGLTQVLRASDAIDVTPFAAG